MTQITRRYTILALPSVGSLQVINRIIGHFVQLLFLRIGLAYQFENSAKRTVTKVYHESDLET